MEITLQAPKETISSTSFSPDSNHLLVGGWDSTLQLHDVATQATPTILSAPAPILSLSYPSSSTAYTGGLDRHLRQWDLNTQTSTSLGSHSDAIRCVYWAEAKGIVVTGSWDSTMGVWDPRSGNQGGGELRRLPGKVFAMDGVGNRVVIAMANRQVHVWDLRNLSEPEQRRESSLKFMTRSIACMKDGQGWASSSIEGRISVDYFSEADQGKKYAYRCHRKPQDGVDLVYPINALAYHPNYNTFLSGGSDATISLWDLSAKKRMKQYTRFSNSISALSFSPDGRYVAIATGYGWDNDEEKEGVVNREVGLLIRDIGEDCRPKSI